MSCIITACPYSMTPLTVPYTAEYDDIEDAAMMILEGMDDASAQAIGLYAYINMSFAPDGKPRSDGRQISRNDGRVKDLGRMYVAFWHNPAGKDIYFGTYQSLIEWVLDHFEFVTVECYDDDDNQIPCYSGVEA